MIFEVVEVSSEKNINLFKIFQKIQQPNHRRLDCLILEHKDQIDWEPVTRQAFTEFTENGLKYYSLPFATREMVATDYYSAHRSVCKLDPDVFFFEDVGHPEFQKSMKAFLDTGVFFITTSKVCEKNASPAVDYLNSLKQEGICK